VETEQEVLFEGQRERTTGLLQGLTGNYIRVTVPGPESAQDTIQKVWIDRVEEGKAMGVMQMETAAESMSDVSQ